MDVKFSLNDKSDGERAFAPNNQSEMKDFSVPENKSEIIDNSKVYGDYSEYIKNHHPIFSKVPYKQFKKDWEDLSINTLFKTVEKPEAIIKEIYDNITLPERSTSGSAGYDFRIPFDISIYQGTSIVIPTGIRCKMPKNCVLLIVPRSGLGFKYRIALANTIGVIDSDYYNADNYGHIMIKIVFDGDNHRTAFAINENDDPDVRFNVSQVHKLDTKPNQSSQYLNLKANQGFAQGIFVNYCITANEILEDGESKMKRRTGGFGSTT